jgi:hypothetical protein
LEHLILNIKGKFVFQKKINFYFFIYFKLIIFLTFLNYFDRLIKNNFLKIKKYYFNIYILKILFLKNTTILLNTYK